MRKHTHHLSHLTDLPTVRRKKTPKKKPNLKVVEAEEMQCIVGKDTFGLAFKQRPTTKITARNLVPLQASLSLLCLAAA